MKFPWARMTVRKLLGLIAIIALVLWAVDFIRLSIRSAEYRRRAASCERLERELREIANLDLATRARRSVEETENMYIDYPELAGATASYLAKMKVFYLRAAERPREPLPLRPPAPDPSRYKKMPLPKL